MALKFQWAKRFASYGSKQPKYCFCLFGYLFCFGYCLCFLVFRCYFSMLFLPKILGSPSQPEPGNIGAIIGGTMGAIIALLVVLIAVLFCIIIKQRKRKQTSTCHFLTI